jgi:hypothetical protein
VSSAAKKAFAGMLVTALANCLLDHLVQVCVFEALGIDCPRRRSA